VPDVNGDGLGDIVIGSEQATAIHVVMGARSATLGPPTRVLATTGFVSDAHSCLADCDVNGDGYVDVVVGAPAFNGNTGSVGIVLGTPAGLGAAFDLSGFAAAPNSQLGFAVACVGDIDEDGYGDIAVSAPYANGGVGVVNVVFGPLTEGAALTVQPLVPPDGTDLGHFGASLIGGYFNSDQHADVVVGQPFFSTDRGRAVLYAGRGSRLLMTGIAVSTGTTGQYVGTSAAVTGDVDRDGRMDYAVAGVPLSARGVVHAFRSAAGEVPKTGAPGFGISITGIDANDDGHWELVVGSPFESTFGAYYTFTAPDFIDTGTPQTPTMAYSTGASVTNAGDVDGDGHADLIVGAPGSAGGDGIVYVFAGDAVPPVRELARFARPEVGARHFGNAISR
jgi:hypothetical protein